MTAGWLFDAYSLDDRIILWTKNNQKLRRIEKQWTPSLYVASDSKSKLERLRTNAIIKPFVKRFRTVNRIEKVSDLKESKVLEITVKKSSELVLLARNIERLDKFGAYRLYNVDVPPEQLYLYENNLHPLGKYQISDDTWNELSDINETNYDLPEFTKVKLKIHAKTKQTIPKFTDTIDKIQINDITIQFDSESQMILECIKMIRKIDPDFIITDNGDTWDFPYLIKRASENKILDEIVFGRESNHPILRPKSKGNSYFAYGQVHFKPTAVKLLGRIHIDQSNCFIWEHDYSIHGLYEIARTCRLPLQTAARASIGKCMSSVQFYHATRRGLLIPWKPTVSEIFKTRMNLLIGDRGGLILEPRVGTHENVGEVDFASLFGNVMLHKNISAETINCKCCPNSKSLVPELGYHICKRKGIVPESLEILLSKRQQYSELTKTTKDGKKLEIYKQRKAALKWILVTSFGYLGFNNAKFGRIDAHMAVCAFARKLLLDTIHIAEDEGFQILHGIVDSVWIHKDDATENDYDCLRQKIAKDTGFDLSLDVYNWIVFLPSKNNKMVPIPNRYFGVKQNGKIKIRGIEARRHDTPKFFKDCQMEILNLFSSYKSISDVKKAIAEAKSIQEKFERYLLEHKVPLEDLIFTNRVTRGTNQTENNTIQADAINQLKWEGKAIEPGQKIKYVIHDYSRKKSKRVIPIEVVNSDSKYDTKRYSELLEKCCKSITEPFE
jgi:DNA polymerase-2